MIMILTDKATYNIKKDYNNHKCYDFDSHPCLVVSPNSAQS